MFIYNCIILQIILPHIADPISTCYRLLHLYIYIYSTTPMFLMDGMYAHLKNKSMW